MTDTLDKLRKAFEQAISTAASVQPWNEPLTRRDAVQTGQMLSAPIVPGGLGSWVGSSGFPYTGTTSDGVQLGAQPPARNSFEMGLGLPGVPDVDFIPYAANTNRFGGKGPALVGHPISWEVVGPTLKSPYCDWQWFVDTALNTLTLEAGPYPMPGTTLPSVDEAYGLLGASMSQLDDLGGLYVLFTFTGDGFTGALTGGRTALTSGFPGKAPYELFRVASYVGQTITLRSEKSLATTFPFGDGCRAITLIRPKVTRLAAFPVPVLGQAQANRTFVFLPPETSASSEYMPPFKGGLVGRWNVGGFDVTGGIAAGVNYGTRVRLPVPKPLARMDAEIPVGGPYAADEWVIEVPVSSPLLVAGRILRISNLTDTLASDLQFGEASNAYGYFEIKTVVAGPPDVVTLRRVVEANPDSGSVFYGAGPAAIATPVQIGIEVYDNISSIFSDTTLSLEKLAAARLANLIDPRTAGPSITYRDVSGAPVPASRSDRSIFDTRIGADPGNLLDLGFRAVFFPARQLVPGGDAVPDFGKPIDSIDVVLNPTPPFQERQYIEVDYSSGVAYLSHDPLVGHPSCEVAPNGLGPFLTAPNNPRQELVLFGAVVPYSMEDGQTGTGVRITASSPASTDAGFGESDQADVFGRRIITEPNALQTLNPVGFPSVITNFESLDAIPPAGFFFVGQNVGGEFQNKSGPYAYQYTTLVGAPPQKVQLNGVTGPAGAVILDPTLGWKIVLQRSLRSFAPTNASADTVRGSSKKISTLAFRNADLSFGTDGTVTITPRASEFGLNDAYRKGLTSTPGAGRVVVIDGGPVEARPDGSSADSAAAEPQFESQFLSRYDLGTDPTVTKVGFDSIGRRGTLPYSDEDNYAGFMDRRILAPQSGYTILGTVTDYLFDVNTLGSDEISVSTPGNQFHDGITSKTLLVNNVDLVHLPGYGIFVFHLPVIGVAQNYYLRNLDGSVPVLAAANVKGCSAFRPRFFTGRGFDGGFPISGMGGTWITGQGEKPALRILAGSALVAGGPDGGGSTEALEFWYRDAERVPFKSNSFDTFGRFVTQLRPQQLPLLDKIHRGNFATRSVWDQVLLADLFNVGHLVEDATGSVDYGYDFTSLRAFNTTDYAFTVVAADKISIVAFPLNPLDLGVGSTFFADITGLTPTVPAENGLYVCQAVTTVGPATEFSLRKLGGLSTLTIADTGTVRFYTGSYMGKFTSATFSLTAPPIVTNGTYTPSLTLGVAPDANAVALALNGPEVATRPGANAIQINATDLYGTIYRPKRNLTVDFDGLVKTRADYTYFPTKLRNVIVPLSSGQSRSSAGALRWDFFPFGPRWDSNTNSAEIGFSLHVPNDCEIVNVLVLVDPKNVPGVPMKATLYRVTHDLTTPLAPVTTPLGFETSDATNNLQTLNLSAAPNSGSGFGVPIVVGTTAGTEEYYLVVEASDTGAAGDSIHSIQLQLDLTKAAPL